MKVHRLLLCLSAVVPLTCSLALSGVVPGRWEKVDQSEPGLHLFVEMQSGDEIEGTFVSSDSGALVIQTFDGRRIPFVKATIRRVSQRKQAGRTLIGAGIGATAGLATGLAISSRFDETYFAREDLMGITCAGIGAAVGAAIGSTIKRETEEREVLYQSK